MGSDCRPTPFLVESVVIRTGTKTSRIIYAKTPPSDADTRAWCASCGADDQAADLIARSRQADAMFLEWCRTERSGLRQAQQSVRPLYERTRSFRSYAPWVLPGILQTRAYTTAILTAIRDRRGLADDVEAAVDERMKRQHILHEGRHCFAPLIEESVLRNGLGGRPVMLGRLRHLLTVGRLPNVSMGVVPMRPDRDNGWPVEGFWIHDERKAERGRRPVEAPTALGAPRCRAPVSPGDDGDRSGAAFSALCGQGFLVGDVLANGAVGQAQLVNDGLR